MNSNSPIGIFDSGVGGLTVYRSLHAHLPEEHFIYLGDTARVPYGTKSLSTVERYGIENARFLEDHGIKLLVVACNTASALALPAIRDAVQIGVVGMIEPGAAAAVKESGGKPIGVIATEATVLSGAYTSAIRRLAPESEVIERACPLFVPLAEEGWADTEVAQLVAKKYLSDLAGKEMSAVVMGCTHYPILRRVIQGALGPDAHLIDSGEAAAGLVEKLLIEQGISRPKGEDTGLSRRLCDGMDNFYVTDAAERFSSVAERFLGTAPTSLEAVEVWGHDELRTF